MMLCDLQTLDETAQTFRCLCDPEFSLHSTAVRLSMTTTIGSPCNYCLHIMCSVLLLSALARGTKFCSSVSVYLSVTLFYACMRGVRCVHVHGTFVVADDEGQTLQSTSVYSEPYTMLFTVRALCLQYLVIFTTVVKYTCRSSCT